MGAIILDGAVINEGSLVAAGTLIPKGKEFPPYSLLMGNPAQIKRTLTEKEIQDIHWSAGHYVRLAANYSLDLSSI